MLPRKHKVGKRHFPSPATPGRVFASPLFSCKTVPCDPGSVARYAVIVSKKVAKSAVERNRVRRRMFTAIRTQGGFARKGYTTLFFMRNAAIRATYQDLKQAVGNALK